VRKRKEKREKRKEKREKRKEKREKRLEKVVLFLGVSNSDRVDENACFDETVGEKRAVDEL